MHLLAAYVYECARVCVYGMSACACASASAFASASASASAGVCVLQNYATTLAIALLWYAFFKVMQVVCVSPLNAVTSLALSARQHKRTVPHPTVSRDVTQMSDEPIMTG